MGEPWMRRSTILSLALNLVVRAMVEVARWAAMHRGRALIRLAGRSQEYKDAEIVALRERLAELQSQVEILGRCQGSCRVFLRSVFVPGYASGDGLGNLIVLLMVPSGPEEEGTSTGREGCSANRGGGLDWHRPLVLLC